MKAGPGIVVIIGLLLSIPCRAQRFTAGISLGVNASQIDGDDAAGFNKLGLQGGLRGVAVLGKKSQLSVELLFSQKGSRTEIVANNSIEPRKIQLNYIDVPVVFNYLDWLHRDGYYKFHFSGGLFYGRLISSKIQDEFYDELANEFNRNDIGYLLSTTFYISQNIGFTIRFNRSINLLFNNNKSSINANSLQGYFWTFQTLYMF